MVWPLVGALVLGTAALDAHAEQKEEEYIAELLSERLMHAQERYPYGGVDFFHYLLEPMPRKHWAGRRWYVVDAYVNDIHVTMLCPVHDRLFYVHDRTPFSMSWQDVEEFNIRY